jgi:hypothetical protein
MNTKKDNYSGLVVYSWGNIAGRWVAKLVARLLTTAVLWVRIQTSLKNTKWATEAKEWPIHSSPPPKKYTKKVNKI